jgi:hypothetical protein
MKRQPLFKEKKEAAKINAVFEGYIGSSLCSVSLEPCLPPSLLSSPLLFSSPPHSVAPLLYHLTFSYALPSLISSSFRSFSHSVSLMGCFQSKAVIPPSDEPEPLPDKADLGTRRNQYSAVSIFFVSLSVCDFILFFFCFFKRTEMVLEAIRIRCRLSRSMVLRS